MPVCPASSVTPDITCQPNVTALPPAPASLTLIVAVCKLEAVSTVPDGLEKPISNAPVPSTSLAPERI